MFTRGDPKLKLLMTNHRTLDGDSGRTLLLEKQFN